MESEGYIEDIPISWEIYPGCDDRTQRSDTCDNGRSSSTSLVGLEGMRKESLSTGDGTYSGIARSPRQKNRTHWKYGHCNQEYATVIDTGIRACNEHYHTCHRDGNLGEHGEPSLLRFERDICEDNGPNRGDNLAQVNVSNTNVSESTYIGWDAHQLGTDWRIMHPSQEGWHEQGRSLNGDVD